MSNDLHKFLCYEICFSLGIIPLQHFDTRVDEILQQMDPLEARKAKRKFRKLWKKVLASDSFYRRGWNSRKKVGKAQKSYHKALVYYEIQLQVQKKMKELEKSFENPEDDIVY
jgi:hypothetical protein